MGVTALLADSVAVLVSDEVPGVEAEVASGGLSFFPASFRVPYSVAYQPLPFRAKLVREMSLWASLPHAGQAMLPVSSKCRHHSSAMAPQESHWYSYMGMVCTLARGQQKKLSRSGSVAASVGECFQSEQPGMLRQHSGGYLKITNIPLSGRRFRFFPSQPWQFRKKAKATPAIIVVQRSAGNTQCAAHDSEA